MKILLEFGGISHLHGSAVGKGGENGELAPDAGRGFREDDDPIRHADGFGSDCNLDLSNPNATVTLTLDDDSELVCAVLTIFPAGEHKYIALLPLDENGENQDGEVFLYRFFQEEGQQPTLENIEDDDEYEIAADAFDELLDSAEYDEVVDGKEL